MNFTCHFCPQVLTGQFLVGTTTRFYACHPGQEKLIQAEQANQYWTKHNQAFYETNLGWEAIAQTFQQTQQESIQKKKLWEKRKLNNNILP